MSKVIWWTAPITLNSEGRKCGGATVSQRPGGGGGGTDARVPRGGGAPCAPCVWTAPVFPTWL